MTDVCDLREVSKDARDFNNEINVGAEEVVLERDCKLVLLFYNSVPFHVVEAHVVDGSSLRGS